MIRGSTVPKQGNHEHLDDRAKFSPAAAKPPLGESAKDQADPSGTGVPGLGKTTGQSHAGRTHDTAKRAISVNSV